MDSFGIRVRPPRKIAGGLVTQTGMCRNCGGRIALRGIPELGWAGETLWRHEDDAEACPGGYEVAEPYISSRMAAV